MLLKSSGIQSMSFGCSLLKAHAFKRLHSKRWALNGRYPKPLEPKLVVHKLFIHNLMVYCVISSRTFVPRCILGFKSSVNIHKKSV